ncbi:unnamed protein product, partial [marine sediment metagenome]
REVNEKEGVAGAAEVREAIGLETKLEVNEGLPSPAPDSTHREVNEKDA